MLILGGLLFADRRELFFAQAGLAAAVAVMITTGLLLIWFLDHPYAGHAGSIRPVELQNSLALMQREAPALRPASSTSMRPMSRSPSSTS